MSNAAALGQDVEHPKPAARTADTPSVSAKGRVWLVAAVVSVVVCAAVNLYVAWGAHTAFMFDEVATLLQGRVVLGMSVPHVNSPGYYPGWAVLMAPAWWVTSSAFTFYKIAIGVGLVVGMATIWPLSRVATRFGVSSTQGVVAAAIVMTLPARALQSDYALTERLICLLVALTTLAAFRLWEKPTYLRAFLVALGAAAALFTHARMEVFVAAVGLWLLCFLVRDWKVGLVGLVSLAVLFEGANRLALYINSLLVDSGFHQADGFFAQVLHSAPRFLLNSFAGEAWTQLVGSFGIIVIGFVVAVRLAWGELRTRRVGQYGFVLIITMSLYVLSSLRWARDSTLYHASWRRFDYWMYGRYIDPVFAILLLLSVCVLIRAIASKAGVIWAWATAAFISLVTVLLVAPQAPTWAYVTPAHVPGVMPWWWALPTEATFPQAVKPFPTGLTPSFTNENRFWLIATVTALGVLAVLTLLLLIRRPRVRALLAVVVLLVAGTAGSAVGNAGSDRFHHSFDNIQPVVYQLRDLLAAHPDAKVSYEVACRAGKPSMSPQRNWLMWFMLPATVQRDYTWGDDVVFSCAHGSPSTVPGAVALRDQPFPGTVVWIMPGKLLDSLRASGDLPPVARTVK
ncbi:MAG: hypothetical protein J2O46_05010 [Nocardioides sp.]|nr:hypothetical protein [Nocardioides sp.]